MGMFSSPEPVREVQEEKKSQRHLLVIVPMAIGFIAGGFFTENPLAGALVGLALGLAFHGVSRLEAIRGDEFARRRVYRRPLWYRVSLAAIALGGAFLWLTGLRGFELPEFISNLYQPIAGSGTIAAIATIVLAVAFALWGKWRGLASSTKGRISNGQAQRAAKTDDDRALLAFSENTLRQAGLGVVSDVAREEILPRILSKKVDDKGRAVVSIAVIPGKQTIQDIVKAEERIATAWQIPRVIVSAGPPLKDGGHTVKIMAVLQESLVPSLVEWEPQDTNMPIAEYASHLRMGLFTESADPWIMTINQKNFKVAGLPGYGKSSFTNSLLAHLVRHPDVRVFIVDLKDGTEAAPWEPYVSGVLHNGEGGEGVEGALKLLSRIKKDISGRYARMKAQGVRNAWTSGFLGPEEPLKVLIVDEATELFSSDAAGGSEKMRATIVERTRSIISLARAAGYVVVFAMQDPRADNFPPKVRSVVSDAVAYKLGPGGSITAIGPSFIAKKGADPEASGVGDAIIATDTHRGDKVRMAYLDDAQMEERRRDSRIGGLPWFDEDEEDEEPLEDLEPDEIEAPAVYPKPMPKRELPVWED